MPKGIRGFQLGLPRPPASGRKRGVPNTAKAEARALAARIVEDPIYQRNLYSRAIMGELSPAVEKVLMAYAWGEPPKEIKEDNERPPLVFLTRLPVGRTDPLAHLVPIESKSKALQQADRAVTEDEENKAALEVVRSIALTTEAAEDAEARENELSADLVEITLPEEPPYL